jgi:hypothetical protein
MGQPKAPTWTLKPFASERAAIDFAIDYVKDEFSVIVGEIEPSGTPAKYQTADIAKMIETVGTYAPVS